MPGISNLKRLINKQGISVVYLLLLAGVCLANIYYFADSFKFYPGHDSMAWMTHFFSVFYNEYFQNNILMLWLPHNLFGYEIDYYFLAVISPAQYFASFIGKLLNIQNALTLLCGSFFLEQLAYVTGVYILSKRLFSHRLTPLFVSLGAAFTVFWGINFGFNFRFYYLTPFILFFIIIFFDTGRFKFLWFACIVVITSMFGNAPYYVPIYALTYLTFFTVLFFTREPRLKIQWHSIRSVQSLAGLAFFIVLAYTYADFICHVLDNGVVYVWDRDPVTGKVLLSNFLTHGGQSDHTGTYIRGSGLDLLWQFIYAAPRSIDFTLYIGLLPVMFLLYYAVFRPGCDSVYKALTSTGCLWLLAAFAEITFIAPALYLFFPAMSYYRHISYLPILSKFFFLIASGYGFDHYFRNTAEEGRWKSPALIGVLIIGFTLLIDIFLTKGGYPYLNAKVAYYTGARLEDIIPFRFHFFPLLVLTFAVVYMLSRPVRGNGKAAAIIVMLFFIEIASYNFALFNGMPVNMRHPTAKQAYNVQPYGFQKQRIDRKTMNRLRPNMSAAMDYFGTKNLMQFSAFYVDPSPAEIFNDTIRVDALPQSINLFMRARSGLSLEKVAVPQNKINALLKDDVFLSAVGYKAPKLFVVSNPRRVVDMKEAAGLIKTKDDIDISPVLQSEGFTDTNTDVYAVRKSRRSIPVEIWNKIVFTDTPNRFWEDGTGLPCWLSVETDSDRGAALSGYRVQADKDANLTDRMPKSWEIQGSNDGKTWTRLDERQNETGWSALENRTYSMSDPGPFKFYRFYVREVNDHSFRFGPRRLLRRLLGRGEPKKIMRVGTISLRFDRDIAIDAIDIKMSSMNIPFYILEEEDSVLPGQNSDGRILRTEFSANTLNAEVEAFSEGSWLIYLDNYHPGWTAKVNGERSIIARANLAFKAVPLKQGKNQVEFEFTGNHRTKFYLKLYFILSIAACLLVFGLAFRCVFFTKQDLSNDAASR